MAPDPARGIDTEARPPRRRARRDPRGAEPRAHQRRRPAHRPPRFVRRRAAVADAAPRPPGGRGVPFRAGDDPGPRDAAGAPVDDDRRFAGRASVAPAAGRGAASRRRHTRGGAARRGLPDRGLRRRRGGGAGHRAGARLRSLRRAPRRGSPGDDPLARGAPGGRRGGRGARLAGRSLPVALLPVGAAVRPDSSAPGRSAADAPASRPLRRGAGAHGCGDRPAAAASRLARRRRHDHRRGRRQPRRGAGRARRARLRLRAVRRDAARSAPVARPGARRPGSLHPGAGASLRSGADPSRLAAIGGAAADGRDEPRAVARPGGEDAAPAGARRGGGVPELSRRPVPRGDPRRRLQADPRRHARAVRPEAGSGGGAQPGLGAAGPGRRDRPAVAGGVRVGDRDVRRGRAALRAADPVPARRIGPRDRRPDGVAGAGGAEGLARARGSQEPAPEKRGAVDASGASGDLRRNTAAPGGDAPGARSLRGGAPAAHDAARRGGRRSGRDRPHAGRSAGRR